MSKHLVLDGDIGMDNERILAEYVVGIREPCRREDSLVDRQEERSPDSDPAGGPSWKRFKP
ncbi:hypothetical protein ACFLSF_00890 [Candidatus Bipolaricaulota bacterium]